VHLDAAHFLLLLCEGGEPIVAEAFEGKTDKYDLISELPGVDAALENFPGRHVGETVLVAHESDVHRLRANHCSCSLFPLKIGLEGETRGMERLEGERRNHTPFACLCGEDAANDAVEVRVGMDVAEPDILLRKTVQRLKPPLGAIDRIAPRRQHHRRTIRDRQGEGIVGLLGRLVVEKQIERNDARLPERYTLDQ
jgi:hypothetical protein